MVAARATPTVSVLVVNYNGIGCVEALLDSLDSAFARHRSEIIVVDNASTDGSRQKLRERRDIELIEMTCNVGFTGGNNMAARTARGHVLLLLNNDTRVEGTLDDLVDTALQPTVGVAGCQLRYGDGRLQFSVGLAHTPLRIALSWLGWERRPGAPRLFRKFETDAALYGRPQHDVAWVSGACMATRREVWQQLSGFDSDMFMYCEDVDYCARVRAAGWRVAYQPAPVVVHLEGGGKAWPGAAALLRTCRSYYLLISKTTGRPSARLLSLWLGALFGARGLAFAAGAACRRTPQVAVLRDKASGYRLASLCMLLAAWRGRVPALP